MAHANTLLQNLNDPKVFATTTLARLRNLIDTSLENAVSTPQPKGSEQLTSDDVLHSFSPLPSLRRIVLTFTTTAASFYVRSILDGTTLGTGDRIRVFFGAETRLEGRDMHLHAPRSTKQFFISPPPSPPAGWTSRDEDPPNKHVHATDLAAALGSIGRHDSTDLSDPESPASDVAAAAAAANNASSWAAKSSASASGPVRPTVNTNVAYSAARGRSDSRTIVFHPQEHGRSPDLPAIAVEDTTESPTDVSPGELETGGGKLFAHTSRPPVELMQTE